MISGRSRQARGENDTTSPLLLHPGTTCSREEGAQVPGCPEQRSSLTLRGLPAADKKSQHRGIADLSAWIHPHSSMSSKEPTRDQQWANQRPAMGQPQTSNGLTTDQPWTSRSRQLQITELPLVKVNLVKKRLQLAHKRLVSP